MGRTRLTEGRDKLVDGEAGLSRGTSTDFGLTSVTTRCAALVFLAMLASCEMTDNRSAEQISTVEANNGPLFGRPTVMVNERGIDIAGTVPDRVRMLLEVFDPNGDLLFSHDNVVGPGKFQIEESFPPGLAGGTVVLSDEKGKGFSFNIEAEAAPIEDPPSN